MTSPVLAFVVTFEPVSVILLYMKNKLHYTALFLFAGMSISLGQTNFKESLQKADPVSPRLSIAQKIAIHESYYKKAVADKDLVKQLYGALYLTEDYRKHGDYVEYARYALSSDSIAQALGNVGWQGQVALITATVPYHINRDIKAAIKKFESGAKLCQEAGDSACMAECLEKIGSMYAQLQDFKQSHHYFNLAMPMLKRFPQCNLAAAYSNYSTLLGFQHRQEEALLYLDSAIAVARQKKNREIEMNFLYNSALAHNALGHEEKAMGIFEMLVKVNIENNWLNGLANAYGGMSDIFKEKGNYQAAYDYLARYHSIIDSLTGAETKLKVAELEIKYASQQKELELVKSKSALQASQRFAERQTWLIVFVLMLAVFSLWRWRLKTRQAKKEQSEYKKNLADLTQILLDKNTRILALETQSSESPAAAKPISLPSDYEGDLLNQTILTDSDWSAFKSWFEKAHPGFLQRLRKSFSAITDAEERLFLFIKLNLHTKESANILGISVNSVKRTRNRLRHRLELTEEVDLEEFIRSF